MKFPKIDYEFWLKNWHKTIGENRVYTNKNMLEFIDYEKDINSCTQEISCLVNSPKLNKKIILRVVDLIYSWGGKSGRFYYDTSKNKPCYRKELELNTDLFLKYSKGIEYAKKGQSESKNIFEQISGIGASYASKHAYFWSLHSDNPLIIVDSKIAGSLGYETINQLNSNINYRNLVTEFKNKSIEEFGEKNPMLIERALFAFHNHYFKNDNSGWRRYKIEKDLVEAKLLAKELF